MRSKSHEDKASSSQQDKKTPYETLVSIAHKREYGEGRGVKRTRHHSMMLELEKLKDWSHIVGVDPSEGVPADLEKGKRIFAALVERGIVQVTFWSVK